MNYSGHFRRKVLGSVVVLIWLVTLAFVSGPARWEYAHTYEYRIEELGDALPLLTVVVGLPILGLGSLTPESFVVRVLFWGVTWVGPAILLIGMWNAESRDVLSDWLLYGGTIYLSLMLLFAVIVVVGLWLPFSLLSAS